MQFRSNKNDKACIQICLSEIIGTCFIFFEIKERFVGIKDTYVYETSRKTFILDIILTRPSPREEYPVGLFPRISDYLSMGRIQTLDPYLVSVFHYHFLRDTLK